MQEAIRSLEFDRIVQAVQSFALTPLGEAQLATLQPLTEARSVQAALTATSECVTYLESNGPLALQGPTDLDRILMGLAVAGHAPDAGQLSGLANFLASVEAVRHAVVQPKGGPFPALQTVVERCRSFEKEVADIRTKIDSTGTLVDEASPELQRIRERLRRQRNRLRGTLDSYLRGKDTSRYLQEQIVTERGGRYVLVVKVEHRGAIPGIVHGSSGSGASLFLEPLSTVEINNDIVALEEDEVAEARRILLALADALRKRARDLQHTLAAATEIDVIQARAGFSTLVDGIEPKLAADPRIEFLQARHPLLIPAVRERLNTEGASPDPGGEPVPVDVCVAPPTSVLVVTGPNTGGKTVALKTAGLLALMAQAGLHVPAGEGSKTAVFHTIFADIGDEQSVVASLSTFSGHIMNIVSMDRRLNLPALVLLDEVGAGTDPTEGGALGAAIIEHFKARGALVVATTHDDMLKSYASTTPGATCAGFGFDPETFAPNYRLAYGSPGRSLALEIAARLGIAPVIIEAARTRRSEREAQLANHLARVDEDLRALEAERERFETERAHLVSERAQLTADQRTLHEQQAASRQRLTEKIDDRLRGARAEIDAVVNGLRTKASELEQTAATRTATGQTALTTGEAGKLRTETRAALDRATDRTREVYLKADPSDDASEMERASAPSASPPVIGARVTVGSLGLDGYVLAVHDGETEVEVRGKRLRVPVGDLQVVGGRESAAPAGGRVTVQVESSSEPLQDLNVIGCRVDEALSRTEKFLDQAIIREQRHVRIIHGHGTGQLRRAIAGLLETHPEVGRFTLAEQEQGGRGVTVIELKD